MKNQPPTHLFKGVAYHTPTILLTIGLILSSLFHSCKTTNEQAVILYGQEFEQVRGLAKKENKTFCFVLSRPDCSPCVMFVRKLGDRYSNVIFNIVDVSLPENQWYQHWLCSGSLPTTCIFSSKGKLKAIVSGTTESCMQCIGSAISGDTKCAEYFYSKNHPAKDVSIPMLNTVFASKLKLDKGQDISNEIESTLTGNTYPYPVYLKSINEVKQGRNQDAVYWANRFLAFDHPFFLKAYNDLYGELKTIIDPNYTSEDDGVLSVVEEIQLGNCRLNESRPFSLTLTNTGKLPLSVLDIHLSCTCVKLQSEHTLTLQPGQSQNVDFMFTADVQGDVFREIVFVSNGVNSLERVSIFATVK